VLLCAELPLLERWCTSVLFRTVLDRSRDTLDWCTGCAVLYRTVPLAQSSRTLVVRLWMEQIYLPSLDTSSGSERADLGTFQQSFRNMGIVLFLMLVTVSFHIFWDVRFNAVCFVAGWNQYRHPNQSRVLSKFVRAISGFAMGSSTSAVVSDLLGLSLESVLLF
jgi:hypothetical protein